MENEVKWSELLRRAVTEPGVVSEAYGRFWNYSIGNQLLAMFQCSARGLELGPIASYNGWKDLGRYVKRGEHALELCMPVTGKRTLKQKDETTGQESEETVTYTRFVFRRNWFVLCQTDGAAYEPEPTPEWDQSKALGALNVTLAPFHCTDGNAQGYAEGRAVAISPIAVHPERTLFHELAHIVLGHTDDHSTPKALRELEAEAVAMLCCESLGLPGAAESRGYIQSWFDGNQVPERSAQRIMHTADVILKAGLPAKERRASEPVRMAA